MDIYPTMEEADGLTEWDVIVDERHYIVELDEGGTISVTGDHGQCMELAHFAAFPELQALLTGLLVRGTRLLCSDGRSIYAVADERITLGMNDRSA